MQKLLSEGKTALLENFVSNKTRRKFKAFLAYDKKAGKVNFEFEPRAAKPGVPLRGAAAKTAAADVVSEATAAKKVAAKKVAAKKAPAKKVAAKKAA
jgi:DNA topoisomerase-3